MIKVVSRNCQSYEIKKLKEHFIEIFFESNSLKKIKSLESVLLKPNLLGPYSPQKGVTTHPIFVSALIEILKDFNIKISLMDNPGGVNKYEKVLEKCGYTNLKKKYGIKIFNLTETGIYKIGKNPKYVVSKPFLDCQAIINLPKLKTHTFTLMTCAIKNFYGIIPGLAKANYHRLFPNPTKFAAVILNTYSLVKEKIVFNLMDGIIGMDGSGPSSGNPKNFGVILGSKDAIALDICAANLLGFNFKKIPIIYLSAKKYDLSYQEIKMLGDFQKKDVLENVNIQKCIISNRILRIFSTPLKNFIKIFFKIYPVFSPEKCTQCGNCIKFCPISALTFSKNSTIPKLDRSKCILCLCCIEICSQSASSLKKNLLSKIFLN
ncbi:MAG: DUF362 domain-containing protein [Candidatus Cloacimonetes bacterium]|nr:DUF362 domain-containing protein [Candidatus Cloacimonadota bacterium]